MSKLLPDELATKATYDAVGSLWHRAVATHNLNFWAEEVQRFHTLLPSGSILEIGSGGGRDARVLVEMGYKYVGTDVSTGLLSVARADLPQEVFVEQSVYDLDLPQAPFDGFWAAAVLLHIPRDRIDEALARIRSQMKSHATGFISVKDGTAEGMELDIVGGKEFRRFFCRWPKKAFQEVLVRNGFHVVDYMHHPTSKTNWHCFFVEVAAT